MKKFIIVFVLLLSFTASFPAAAELTDSSQGVWAEEARQACAFWQTSSGTGEVAGICALQADGAAAGLHYGSPSAGVTVTQVVWFHLCGTEANCNQYVQVANIGHLDFQMALDATWATLSTTVEGCHLEFDLSGQPKSGDDGYRTEPTLRVWQTQPSAHAWGSRGRYLDAEGQGQACGDEVANGSSTTALVYRWVTAGSMRQQYGYPLVPGLGSIAQWKMQGQVTDTEGQPIVGATIQGSSAQVSSDRNGKYVFTEPMIGLSETFFVSASGYKMVRRTVSVLEANEGAVDFVLEPESA